jgi:hypothetical protein
MGHCSKFFYALLTTPVNLVVRYRPLRRFGYTLWATAADLVMRYGPLRGMKPYSKDLY